MNDVKKEWPLTYPIASSHLFEGPLDAWAKGASTHDVLVSWVLVDTRISQMGVDVLQTLQVVFLAAEPDDTLAV